MNTKKSAISFLLDYLKNHKLIFFISIIFMILFSITNPLQLWTLKPFVDKLFLKQVNVEVKLPRSSFEKIKDLGRKSETVIKLSRETKIKLKY